MTVRGARQHRHLERSCVPVWGVDGNRSHDTLSREISHRNAAHTIRGGDFSTLWRLCIESPSQPKLASSLHNKRLSYWRLTGFGRNDGRWSDIGVIHAFLHSPSAIAVRIDLCCAKAPTGGINSSPQRGDTTILGPIGPSNLRTFAPLGALNVRTLSFTTLLHSLRRSRAPPLNPLNPGREAAL